MRIFAIIIAAVFLTGCNHATINAYCQLAKPITYNKKKDTQKTVRQIVAHNRVWISQNCKTLNVQ